MQLSRVHAQLGSQRCQKFMHSAVRRAHKVNRHGRQRLRGVVEGVWLVQRRSTRGELHVHLALLDHAQFAAGFFFHHVQTFLQVMHF